MINFLKKWLEILWSGWSYFWFDSKSDSALTVLGVFRVCFGSVMFFFYFTRCLDAAYFYGANGIMPAPFLKTVELFRYHPTVISEAWSDGQVVALHLFFLVFIASLTLGFCTRISAIVTYLIHMMFVNRNMSVMFGVDMIATFFFLYLCFSNSGARFSLDSILGWSRKTQSTISHIAFRFMQIQICIIYGFSGMEKLKGTRWWDGSAMWDVLSMGNMQRWDLSFVAHFPVVLAAAVYFVLAWEVYFPVLIWQKKLRIPMLVFGVQMHLGIFLFMNLPSFGFMMISLYILFLKEEEINVVLNWLGLVKIPSRS